MSGRPRHLGRIAIVIGLVVIAGMWIYVLFIGNPENVDTLHDASFANAAQPVCKQTVDHLSTIGVVNQKADSPQARAELVDKADAELATMVAQLRSIAVANADDAKAITAWLSDWDQWLKDRANWSAALHQGQDTAFVEKQRESTHEPNSKALNDFALINSMRSCATPGGV